MLTEMPLDVQKEILETMKKENRTLLEAETVIVMRRIRGLVKQDCDIKTKKGDLNGKN